MEKKEFAHELVRLFPEKAEALEENIREFGELLGHLFFADELTAPLTALLKEDENKALIGEYCAFIEKMWREGTFEVRNIVDMSIFEPLSDHSLAWARLGKYLPDDLKAYVNNDLLKKDPLMRKVPPLE